MKAHRRVLSGGWALSALLSALLAVTACVTTEDRPGDNAARDIEKTLVEFDEAIAAEDLGEASDIMRDVDRTVDRDRRELELHPEASMLFQRIDNAKRKLRQLQKLIDEKKAAQEAMAVEDRVRVPLEEAAVFAERVLQGQPTQADVVELKGKIDRAQEALNEGRRSGKIEADGDLTTEIEARLEALRGTLVQGERLAGAGAVRDVLKEGLHIVGLAAERKTPSERINDYDTARGKFAACQDSAAKLQGDDPSIGSLKFDVEEGGKQLSLKQIAKRCKKEDRGLTRLIAAANREQKAIDRMQKFAKDRSGDQQRVLEQFGRKPDVMRKKKGKQVWTFVEKKKVKKGRRTKTEKTYYEYTFDPEGKLMAEKTKKR